MNIIIIVIAAVFILPLAIGSVFVCVPKWWTQSVEPHLPDTPDWMSVEPFSKATNDRLERGALIVLKVVFFPAFFTAALVAWMIRGWFVIGLAAIEGACPYNGGFKWRECLSDWFDAGTVPMTDLSPKDVFGSE